MSFALLVYRNNFGHFKCFRESRPVLSVLSDKLNKYNRGCSITGAISYINFGAIPSGPGDLFVFKLSISLSNSSASSGSQNVLCKLGLLR